MNNLLETIMICRYVHVCMVVILQLVTYALVSWVKAVSAEPEGLFFMSQAIDIVTQFTVFINNFDCKIALSNLQL